MIPSLKTHQNCADGPRGTQGHGHPAAEDLEGVTAVGREHGRREVEGRELLASHEGHDAGIQNKNV